jgi:diadenosine tetraphosphate (Ap4A) HIT family hydrolase
VNATAEKFGYPETLVAELDHWVLLLRPQQVTLGSLILLCRDPAQRFGEITREAAAELQAATDRIENVLSEAFAYDKINYLMLMMVDPDVHFHVIPRYRDSRSYRGTPFHDPSWPGPPNLAESHELSPEQSAALISDLRARFG